MPRPLLGQPQPVPMPYGRAGDPFWGSVSLLLRMDGPHGSQTFRDLSQNSLAVTANGDAQISAVQRRFGDTSGFFDGAGDSLSVTLPPLGTQNFTIEFWFFRRGNTGEGVNLGQSMLDTRNPDTANAGWDIVMSRFGGQTRPSLFMGTSGTSFGGIGNVINNNEWYHFAACRSGSVSRYFLNGALLGSGTIGSLNATNQTLRICTGANGSFFGFLSELRITRGVARYTSNFPAPTAPFPIGYQ